MKRKVNSYICPHCREEIYLRRFLDGKYYIHDMTRREEDTMDFIPFENREELERLYNKHKKGIRIRKKNWVADILRNWIKGNAD